jgi:hypothetical protein
VNVIILSIFLNSKKTENNKNNFDYKKAPTADVPATPAPDVNISKYSLSSVPNATINDNFKDDSPF